MKLQPAELKTTQQFGPDTCAAARPGARGAFEPPAELPAALVAGLLQPRPHHQGPQHPYLEQAGDLVYQ